METLSPKTPPAMFDSATTRLGLGAIIVSAACGLLNPTLIVPSDSGTSADAAVLVDAPETPPESGVDSAVPPQDASVHDERVEVDEGMGSDVRHTDALVGEDTTETATSIDVVTPTDSPDSSDTSTPNTPETSTSGDTGNDSGPADTGSAIDVPTMSDAGTDRPDPMDTTTDRALPTDMVPSSDATTVDSSLPSNGCRITDITDTNRASRCSTGRCIIPRGLGVVSRITVQFGSDAPNRVDRALIDSVTPAESVFTYDTSPAPGYGQLTTNTTVPGTIVAVRGLSLQTNRGIRNCGDITAVIE